MQFFPAISKKKKIIITIIALLFLGLFVLVLVMLSTQKEQPSKTIRKPIELSPSLGYVPDILIIKYTAGNSPDELAEAIAAHKPWDILSDPDRRIRELNELDKKAGVISKKQLSQSNDKRLRGIYVLTLQEGSDLQSVQELYLQHEFIEYVDLDTISTLDATASDPLYPQLWGFQKIRIEEAWDITKGSDSITVAILDTGIDYNHEDLPPDIIKGEDFSTCQIHDPNTRRCIQFKPRDDNPMDDHGHGTHVAGTVGTVANNGRGVAGVNWNVTLLAVKVMGQTGAARLQDELDAIEYAVQNGADVINMSFGELRACNTAPTMQEYVDWTLDNDVVLVAAAGNNAQDASGYTPASCDGVITVGATDQNDQRASFNPLESSNYGNRVDIAAPGKEIFSTKSSFDNRPDTPCIRSGVVIGNYCMLSGTSQATPHVSGAAALLLAHNPSLTPAQVKECLVRYADLIPQDPNRPIGPRLNVYSSLRGCSPPTPTPTPTPTGGIGQPTLPPGTIPSLTPTLTPTPTPIPYNCRETDTSPPGSSIQLKRLECTPAS